VLVQDLDAFKSNYIVRSNDSKSVVSILLHIPPPLAKLTPLIQTVESHTQVLKSSAPCMIPTLREVVKKFDITIPPEVTLVIMEIR